MENIVVNLEEGDPKETLDEYETFLDITPIIGDPRDTSPIHNTIGQLIKEEDLDIKQVVCRYSKEFPEKFYLVGSEESFSKLQYHLTGERSVIKREFTLIQRKYNQANDLLKFLGNMEDHQHIIEGGLADEDDYFN